MFWGIGTAARQDRISWPVFPLSIIRRYRRQKMTPFTSEEQAKLYGQFIVDFANAKNSDEACKELVKGIQQAFNFTTNFVIQSEKILPSLKKFKSALPKSEMVLIKILLAEDNIIDSLNIEFESIMRELVDYNSTQNTLTFRKFSWDYEDQDEVYKYKDFWEYPYSMSIGQIERTMGISKNARTWGSTDPVEMSLRKYKSRNWELIKPETLNELKKLLKVGKIKAKFRKSVSKERYSELKRLAETYEKIDGIHKRISQLQNNLRTTLNDIIEGKSLYHNQSFKKYLVRYSTLNKHGLIINRDDSFSYDSDLFKEEYYLKYQDSFGYITYFFIEFLLNHDLRKLKFCERCEKFYVQTKLNPRQRYCEKCSPKSKMSKERRKEYQRKYRQKKKLEERAIQREAKIENLMKKVGCSREEALEYIEADESMM
jgi:hypothetical protein